MRPVRLTMQAFGPYAGQQVVDFRAAVEAGLFGLYGPTGSGKSSVFSAMTFALFGKPARHEQDSPSLRSQHAAADMMTEVELVFDIGAQRFVVHRAPDQMRPRQRGEGETPSVHKALLFDATGLSLDEITPDNRGKIIAEKKVRVVDAAIVELLGYGAEQFRQIVLLPQGRFEAFLSANTRERLGILRDLFDVSLYRSLMADLKRKAEAAEAHVRTARAVCAERLTAEGFEDRDALIGGIDAAEVEHEAARAQEDAAAKAHAEAETALHDARRVEQHFVDAEEARAALTTLREQGQAMATLAARIAQAERARGLLDRQGRVVEAGQKVQAAEDRCKQAVAARDTADDAAKLAREKAEVEAARAGERDALRREIDTLTRHRKTLDASAEIAATVDAAGAAWQQAQEDHRAAQADLKTRQRATQAHEAVLKTARLAERQRQEHGTALATLRTALDAATTLARADTAVAQAADAVTTAQAVAERADAALMTARAGAEEVERALVAVQALHLAGTLTPGAPCPVCGGADHPTPATGLAGQDGRDEAFRAARRGLEQAEATARDAGAQLLSDRRILDEREERRRELGAGGSDVTGLRAEMSVHETALAALAPPVDVEGMEAEGEAKGAAIRSGEQALAALDATLATKATAREVESTRLDAMLSAVPVPLRENAALAGAMAQANDAHAALTAALKSAEEAQAATREQALIARTECDGADRARVECRDALCLAEEAFAAGLTEADLSAEAFEVLKPAIATLDTDRATIDDHRVALGIAKDAARRAEAAIHERTRPALPEIEAARGAAEAALNEAREARGAVAQRRGHLTRLRDDLADRLAQLDAAEAESGPLRGLAAMMGGTNAQKRDLETYAIGTMFGRVLSAANLRLGPMTQYQYRLERDEDAPGRGLQGLGMQVFDTHTGQSRPTATLSGGESFIAALALALGLADVVENENGKVRLDTIFIDEGFGSLDTENGTGTLDRVLHVLRSLVSDNRAIGLISHVPLVQEAIPNGFTVRKDADGSRIEVRNGR